MNKRKTIHIDCSELTIAIDCTMRTKYSEYLYLIDYYVIADLICEYIFSRVKSSEALSWLDWLNDLNDSKEAIVELTAIFTSLLPVIKERVYSMNIDVTCNDDVRIVVDGNLVSLIIVYDYDGEADETN